MKERGRQAGSVGETNRSSWPVQEMRGEWGNEVNGEKEEMR